MDFLALVTTTAEHAAAASEEHGAWVFGWEALVALGTLALAAYTARLATFTRRSVAAARDEQSGAWRPVVLPIVEGSSAREPREGEPALFVQLVNVGRGPAFDVGLRLNFDVGTLAQPNPERLISATFGIRDTKATSGVMQEREDFRAHFYVGGATDRIGELTIMYRDLSGRPMWTTAVLSWPQRVGQVPAGDTYAVEVLGTRSGYGTAWPFEEPGVSELSRKAHAWRRVRARLRPAD